MKRTIATIVTIAAMISAIVAPTATAGESGGASSSDGSSAPVSSASGSSINTGSSLVDGTVNGSTKLGGALSSNPSGVKRVGNLLSEDRSVQALSLATAADAAAHPVSKAGQGSSKAGKVIADPGVLNRGSVSPIRNYRQAIQSGSSAKEMTSQDRLFYAVLGLGLIGSIIFGFVRVFAPQLFPAMR